MTGRPPQLIGIAGCSGARRFAEATIDTRPPVAHIVASVTERFGW